MLLFGRGGRIGPDWKSIDNNFIVLPVFIPRIVVNFTILTGLLNFGIIFG